MNNNIIGRVVESHKQYYVVKSNNNLYKCYMKGKKNDAITGDWVSITNDLHDKQCITAILNRKNIFYRSDNNKVKKLASNIDHVLIIVATQPSFSLETVGNIMLESIRCSVDYTIVLNKSDIKDKLHKSFSMIDSITHKKSSIVTLSAKFQNSKEIETKLNNCLENKTILLVGESGMGKSTILNKLVTSARANTQEYSTALGTGKHTTSNTKLYETKFKNCFIIDSPGFQEFSIKHIKLEEINKGFPEFEELTGKCQFYNCKHFHEPNCEIIKAVSEEKINKARYSLYKNIIKGYLADNKY